MNLPVRDDWHRLFSAALDDRLNDAECEQLSALLAADADARRMWFTYHDNECGLTELAPRASQRQRDVPLDSPSHVGLTARRSTRVVAVARSRLWTTAAACFAIGIGCASAVFAYLGPAATRSSTLFDESFESGAAPGVSGMPRVAGEWNGDFSETTAAAQNVTPIDGARMLRFLRGDHAGLPLAKSHSCDVQRLVDLRPFRKEFADGRATVELSTLFNAAASDPSAPAYCTLMIFALDAESATDPELVLSRDALAYSRSNRLWLDGDPASWQSVSHDLRLPPDADFVMVRIGVSYDVRQPGPKPDGFAGHFADAVRLTLTRRPAAPTP